MESNESHHTLKMNNRRTVIIHHHCWCEKGGEKKSRKHNNNNAQRKIAVVVVLGVSHVVYCCTIGSHQKKTQHAENISKSKSSFISFIKNK
jgi:hypothetical protein